MHPHSYSMSVPADIGELADEVHRVFVELAGASDAEVLAGECTPPLDVYETDASIEIVVDVPGIVPTAVRVVVKGETLLVAGEKAPRRGRGESTFHLVERGFGRFVRAVRLGHACDAGKARAVMTGGELRVSIPKLAERRGHVFRIPVRAGEVGLP
jgi:HSP20 family protein